MTDAVEVRKAKVRIPLPVSLLWAVLRRLAKVSRWLLRRPSRLGALAAGGLVGSMTYDYGLLVLVGAVVGMVVGLGLWAWKRPTSFRWRVTWRLRGRWRRFILMRRWRDVVAGCGLTGETNDGVRVMPIPGPVVSSPYRDRFLVSMPAGHTIEDWNEKVRALAVGLNAQSGRIRTPLRNGGGRWGRRRTIPQRVVAVELIRRDALAEQIEAATPAEVPNLRGLPVAMTEDGTRYRLQLLYTHLLIVGATDSGKGSVIWSIVGQLLPGIRSGLVKVIGIDPKRVELPLGPELFDELLVEIADIADGLERLVTINADRARAMAGQKRKHTPTTDEPHYVVVIDEFLALTKFADNATKKRIDAALGVLLTQGRSQAITIVAATQDAAKETLGRIRDLFPHRIALRVVEADQVDMALGSGMRKAGALCDLIPFDMPGTAYVALDGHPDPARIRFPYTDDDEIRAMADSMPPRPNAPEPDVPEPDDSEADVSEPGDSESEDSESVESDSEQTNEGSAV
ncbi:hypothetical protein MU582_02540 [Nocardioidaceae bacterium SCSIO 66511]|nr:hypothetical protein MU582_02540 [Nocardioidaceae bacterium SCSIO 66511]